MAQESAPTHTVTPELEGLLLEAKAWYDKRDVEGTGWRNIGEYDREGSDLLDKIVQQVNQDWGYAR